MLMLFLHTLFFVKDPVHFRWGWLFLIFVIAEAEVFLTSSQTFPIGSFIYYVRKVFRQANISYHVRVRIRRDV